MKQYKATDLITKQAAAEIYCRDCEKKPNDEKHCEEVCMGYANIMCIEPAFDKDKVIEQLDKASDYYECNEQGRERVQMVDLTKAIEIVRGE